jgi:hypothetical protein
LRQAERICQTAILAYARWPFLRCFSKGEERLEPLQREYEPATFRLVKCVLLESIGKPRDHTDATKDIARDLAEIAGQLASLKGEARASLRDPDYDTLRHHLERAHTLRWRRLRLRRSGGYG